MRSHYTIRTQTNQRDNNEDSFQVFALQSAPSATPIIVLSVADGMGGHEYGEHASAEALRRVGLALVEELVIMASVNRAQPPPADDAALSTALLSALQQANAHILRMVERNRWGKAGSTIVIALVLENRAFVANLGDSPLFHYAAASGRLTKVTEDHTVAGALLTAGMITAEMARYHEGRGRLEFFVGCSRLPEDGLIHRVDLAPGDLLLLCSDGVSGAVLPEQIGNVFASAADELGQLAQGLLQVALDADETDNQTLILWRHGSSAGWSAPVFIPIEVQDRRVPRTEKMVAAEAGELAELRDALRSAAPAQPASAATEVADTPEA